MANPARPRPVRPRTIDHPFNGEFTCALYAAAHRVDLYSDVIGSTPDLVILDLEDAVPYSSKQDARELLSILTFRARAAGLPVMVRANSTDSSDFLADVAAACALRPAGLLLPKVKSLEQVKSVVDLAGPIPIWLMIETQAAIAAATAGDFDTDYVTGLVVGLADLAKERGVTLTEAESDAQLLRQRGAIAAAAHRAGQHCLDGVVAGAADAAYRAGRRSRMAGFTGRSLYRPDHVEPCRRGAFGA